MASQIHRVPSTGAGLLLMALTSLGIGDAASASFVDVDTVQPAEPAATVTAPRTTMKLEARYHLKANLYFDAARLAVTETIAIINRSSGSIDAVHLSVLARQYREFRLRSVRVDGRLTSVSFPDRADMLVGLGEDLEPGEEATLVARFTVHPKSDVSDSLRARLSKAEGMVRVADWYPILSNGHDLRNPGDSQFTAAAASVTLDLRTDRALAIAAPGKLITSEGRHSVYRMDDARNHGFVVAPRFRTLSTTTRDGVRVRVFMPAGVSGRLALRQTRRALETYDDAYGPYPWRELIVAPTPGRWIATEWPGLIFLGTDSYANADVIHHEVAHQWFYALVGNDQMRHPWLDEAFAQFSENHFFGRHDWSYCSTKPVDSSVYDFPNTFQRWECGGYVETVYKKGAAMIDGVRTRMGDRLFFASMRTLIREHRFGIITPKDVVATWLRYSQKPRALASYLERFLSRRTVAGITDLLASADTAEQLTFADAADPSKGLRSRPRTSRNPVAAWT